MLVVFEVDTKDRKRAAELLCALTVLLVPQAMADIQKNKLPPLYKSGVRYAKQNPKACAFRMPSDVYKRGEADCKQLVLIRMAELALAGETTGARIIWLNDKAGLQAHEQLRRANQSIEDPSVILGMNGKGLPK